MAFNKNIKSVYIEFMTLGDEINNLVLLFICSMLHVIIRYSLSSVFNECSESKNQYFLIWDIRARTLNLYCGIKWGVDLFLYNL